METIATQFDLHTQLYHNVLAEITDEAADTQQHPQANHIKFIAGHLVFTRLMLRDFAGLEADARFGAFEKLMDPAATYLPLADILAKWDAIAAPLSAAIRAFPADFAQQPAPFPTPAGATMVEFFAFLMHHEAYHIGQLGILRKFANQAAMRYR